MNFGTFGKSLGERIEILRKNWDAAVSISEAQALSRLEYFKMRMIPVTDIIENLVDTAYAEDLFPPGVTMKYELLQNDYSTFGIYFERGSERLASVRFTNHEDKPVELRASETFSAPSFRGKQFNIADNASLHQFKQGLEDWFVMMLASDFNVQPLNPTVGSTVDTLAKYTNNVKRLPAPPG